MGIRKVVIRQSVAEIIADIAWFIESKGLVRTAEKFSDSGTTFWKIWLCPSENITLVVTRSEHF